MVKYIPPGFNPAQVLDGLHRAMGFGEPTRTDDKATFYTVTRATVTGPVDADGVPFDPEQRATTTRTSVQVPCAIEYFDRADQAETFGVMTPSRIQITLLDPEYQQVKGFSYVVAGGDKYVYRSTEPPNALGSIDVWTLWAVSEDEL